MVLDLYGLDVEKESGTVIKGKYFTERHEYLIKQVNFSNIFEYYNLYH